TRRSSDLLDSFLQDQFAFFDDLGVNVRAQIPGLRIDSLILLFDSQCECRLHRGIQGCQADGHPAQVFVVYQYARVVTGLGPVPAEPSPVRAELSRMDSKLTLGSVSAIGIFHNSSNPTNSPRPPGPRLPPHNRQDHGAKSLGVGVPG